MKNLLRILVVIASFASLICIHESGHWLAAKAFGLSAPVFSIGLGPGDMSLRLGTFWGTEFRLSPIPLGGFVEIPAMDFSDTQPALPLWQRTIVGLAGVGANLALAIGLLTWLFWSRGRVARTGRRLSVKHAFALSLAAAAETFLSILKSAGNHLCPFTSADGNEVVGPLGAVRKGSQALAGGLVEYIILIANVDLGLAVLNTLPVPPLDGGALSMAFAQRALHLSVPQIDLISLGVLLVVIALALITWAVRRLRRARAERSGLTRRT